MIRPVTIGLAQMGSLPGNTVANRVATVDAAKGLFEQGAQVVVLPELIVPWYTTDQTTIAQNAEPLSGPTIEAWTAVATQFSGIVVGGFCESEGNSFYNTAVAVNHTGVIGHYRKLHLFASEKKGFTPGNLGFPIIETPLGRLGLCICYDLRFVEVIRILALSGAELICVPTAWITGYDKAQWDAKGLCPQAHGAILQANLNQVFIACASQVGTFPEARFLGSSIVADSFGGLATGPLSSRENNFQVVTVDLDDVSKSQSRGSLIRPREDRRTDVYGLLFDGKTL